MWEHTVELFYLYNNLAHGVPFKRVSLKIVTYLGEYV